ncbi:hypothetical protein C5535_08345 [Campylobacter jejuni]|nr:hypothetical protein [Campylobacter jejuni]
MDKLLKERRIIILASLFCIIILVFSAYVNWNNLSMSIPAYIVMGVLEIILIITYFYNKKAIKNYRKNLELYKDLNDD